MKLIAMRSVIGTAHQEIKSGKVYQMVTCLPGVNKITRTQEFAVMVYNDQNEWAPYPLNYFKPADEFSKLSFDKHPLTGDGDGG